MSPLAHVLHGVDLSGLPRRLSRFRPTSSVLLSSAKETSRYATVLLLDAAGELRMVAKIVRRPHRQEHLATEFALLQRLADSRDGPPVAPLPLAFLEHRRHWMLLQTAVEGTFLNRHPLGRSPREAWERVEEWLLGLPPATATVAGDWHTDQVTGPLRRIELALPASDDERRLFAETEPLTRELADLSPAATIEHGDLFRSHLALTPDGGMAAIDWELGRTQGLRGADATIFLLDVFRPHGQRLSSDGTHRAFAKHFLQPDGRARLWLGDHLERQGIERRWVDHVLLATLSRRALQIWEPVVSEAREDSPARLEHARAMFRGFWAVRLWNLTLRELQPRRAAQFPTIAARG